MSRNSRRAAVAIAGVFAIAPMVTACAAGKNPQSAMPTQLTEAVNASAHQVAVRNLFVLGPEPGQTLAAGGSAPVYASIANDSATQDRLLSIEAPGTAQSVQITGGFLDLPAGQLAATGTQAPGQTTPKVVLTGLARPLSGLEMAKLVFHFQRAGALTVNVPVVNRQGEFTTYAPVPTATPSASGTPGTRTPPSPTPKKKKPAPTPATS